MADELATVAAAADADDAVRVVVVTGAGRAFCAGADLGGGPETFADRRTRVRPPGPLSQEIGGVPPGAGGVASLPFAALRQPVIAAVHRPALGHRAPPACRPPRCASRSSRRSTARPSASAPR